MNNSTLILFVLVGLSMGAGCRSKGITSPPDNTAATDPYDVDQNGIPKFVKTDYIELSKIQKISKFRSAAGHDYSDDFESCRSMKHYFWPSGGEPGQTHLPAWSSIKLFAPVDGVISDMFEEWAGTQIQIRSKDYPAFYFNVIHVTLAYRMKLGDTVTAGQLLGTHVGDQTMSDIAVGVHTPKGWKRLSYFDVMTDSLFQRYQARGLSSRTDAIISKEARDADSLTCSGEVFTTGGNIENWILLN